MIIPVRCFTCNKILADKWEQFLKMTSPQSGRKIISVDKTDYTEKTKELLAFEALNITRYCCRRHLLSHVDLLEEI